MNFASRAVRIVKSFLIALWVMSATVYALSANNVDADDTQSANILMLSSWHPDMPWQKAFENGMDVGFAGATKQYNIFYEYLDAGRFGEGARLQSFHDYLIEKYKGSGIDLVISESRPAANFLLSRPNFMPTAKRLLVDPGLEVQGNHIISVNEDFGGAIREMISVSAPRNVYVVTDTLTPSNEKRLAGFKTAFTKFGSGAEPHYLTNLPMAELLDTVSSLPKNSTIFFLLLFQDGSGRPYIPYEAARLISERANAPVFTHWGTLVGSGVLGGYILSGQNVGIIASTTAQSLAQGEEPRVDPNTAFRRVYDWRQMDRWGIGKSAVDGADIVFAQPSIIEQYKWEIFTTLLVTVVMFILSVSLIVINRKRQQALLDLKRERQSLEARVAERTAELQESERRIRNFMDTTLDAVIVIDDQGLIQEFNAAAEQIFAYGRDEVIGKTINTLMPQADAYVHDGYLKKSYATSPRRMAGGRRVFGKRKNGSEIPIEVTVGATIFNGRRHFVGVVRDVTERNRGEEMLKQQTERLVSSQEIARVGSWDWDILTGDLQWTNETYNIFGRSSMDFAATYENFLECVHPEDRETVTHAIQDSVDNDAPYDIDHRIALPDGATLYVQQRGKVFRDDNGRAVRMLGVVHDITERKSLEIAKSEFVSTVSHELRTPLTSIKGALGLVVSGALGDIPHKALRMVSIANNNAERLIALVNDILDLEKLQSNKMDMHFEDLDISALVIEGVQANEGFSLENKVLFEIIEPLPNVKVHCDRNRILQVLTNLLSNAAKFSPEESVVHISVENTDGFACVKVADKGPGIPETHREIIFDRFTQIDATDFRNKGGSGLGLSICKSIIDLHNGEISFDTAPGSGTTFYFTLPHTK
ncbi:PAS domain S-box protein [Magnetovibrio sp.]|uniref:PAS domain S-box protein n=1 Tax=Magnetovibrio sp. TaxID=2024836 RepID=UPI002F92AA3E